MKSTSDAVNELIPLNGDKNATQLQEFFYAILNSISSSFIPLDISQSPVVILSNDELKNIFNSYKGKTTKNGYQVKAFLSSLYVIDKLNPQNPSSEWQWIAKLSHLLVYFSQHDLTRRIIETAEEARKWVSPQSSYQNLWQLCYQQLQADSLENTFKNFDHQLAQYNSNHPDLAKFQAIYRTIEFAWHKRKPSTRTVTSIQRSKRKLSDKSILQAEIVTDIDDDTDSIIEVSILNKLTIILMCFENA